MEENNNVEKKGLSKGAIAGIVGGAVAVIAVVIVLIVVLSGKGGIVGKWKLDSAEAMGMTITKEQLSMFGMDNMEIEFKADGKGTMTMMGETVDFTYNDKVMTRDGQDLPYTLDGNKLIIEESGTKMIFTK